MALATHVHVDFEAAMITDIGSAAGCGLNAWLHQVAVVGNKWCSSDGGSANREIDGCYAGGSSGRDWDHENTDSCNSSDRPSVLHLDVVK